MTKLPLSIPSDYNFQSSKPNRSTSPLRYKSAIRSSILELPHPPLSKMAGSRARGPNPLVFALSTDLWHQTIATLISSPAMCPGSRSHRCSHSTGFRFIHCQANHKTYADCLRPRSAARSLNATSPLPSLKASEQKP